MLTHGRGHRPPTSTTVGEGGMLTHGRGHRPPYVNNRGWGGDANPWEGSPAPYVNNGGWGGMLTHGRGHRPPTSTTVGEGGMLTHGRGHRPPTSTTVGEAPPPRPGICFNPESIEWFTEYQAFLRSHDSAPRPPPNPISRQQLVSLFQSSLVSAAELLTGVRSQNIRPRESLALYKSLIQSISWHSSRKKLEVETSIKDNNIIIMAAFAVHTIV